MTDLFRFKFSKVRVTLLSALFFWVGFAQAQNLNCPSCSSQPPAIVEEALSEFRCVNKKGEPLSLAPELTEKEKRQIAKNYDAAYFSNFKKMPSSNDRARAISQTTEMYGRTKKKVIEADEAQIKERLNEYINHRSKTSTSTRNKICDRLKKFQLDLERPFALQKLVIHQDEKNTPLEWTPERLKLIKESQNEILNRSSAENDSPLNILFQCDTVQNKELKKKGKEQHDLLCLVPQFETTHESFYREATKGWFPVLESSKKQVWNHGSHSEKICAADACKALGVAAQSKNKAGFSFAWVNPILGDEKITKSTQEKDQENKLSSFSVKSAIAGKVIDACTGLPLAGVKLEFPDHTRFESNASGGFRFEYAFSHQGESLSATSTDDYLPSSITIDRVKLNGEVNDYEISLQCKKVNLSGTLFYDDTKEPVRNQKISVSIAWTKAGSNPKTKLLTTTTDSKGNYRFTDVPHFYDQIESKPNDPLEAIGSKVLTIDKNNTENKRDLFFLRRARARIVVIDECRSSPLVGASVEWVDSTEKTTTPSDGTVHLQKLRAEINSKKIRVKKENFETEMITLDRLPEDGTEKEFKVSLKCIRVNLSGTLYHSGTKHPIRDEIITVSTGLGTSSEQSITVKTNSSGKYRIEDIPFFYDEISATSPEKYESVSGKPLKIDPKKKENVKDLELRKFGKIRIKLTNACNQNLITEGELKDLVSQQTYSIGEDGTTEINGIIGELRPMKLVFKKSGYENTTIQVSGPTFDKTTVTHQKEIPCHKTSLTGKVFDQRTRQPIRSQTFQIILSSGSKTKRLKAKTKSDGSYVIKGIWQEGFDTVKAKSSGSYPSSGNEEVSIDLTADQNTHDFYVQKPIKVKPPKIVKVKPVPLDPPDEEDPDVSIERSTEQPHSPPVDEYVPPSSNTFSSHESGKPEPPEQYTSSDASDFHAPEDPKPVCFPKECELFHRTVAEVLGKGVVKTRTYLGRTRYITRDGCKYVFTLSRKLIKCKHVDSQDVGKFKKRFIRNGNAKVRERGVKELREIENKE